MRERILAEIRRIAEKNGGVAPGKARFFHETGITENDWSGKIWVRWSDAIADAGLIPNEKNSRLSSDTVLDRYAEICRHYGRPPTVAEIKIYARRNSECLSHNTFFKHYGGKSQIISALLDRAIKCGECDIIEMLQGTEMPTQQDADDTSLSMKEGWVYLLQSGEYFKIGRSEEIEKRLKQISIALPDKVELVHAIQTDDPAGIEAYWHRRFAALRANGEWFKLTKVDVKVFKRRKFQ